MQVEQYTLSALKCHLLLCHAPYHTLDIQCCLVCMMLSAFLPWSVSMNAFGRLVRSGMCFTISQICLLVIVIAIVSHFQCPRYQLFFFASMKPGADVEPTYLEHSIIHNSLFIIWVHQVPQHTRASVLHAAIYRSKKRNKMRSVIRPHCESHYITQDLVEGWEPLAM